MSGAEVQPSSAKFGPVKTAVGDQCHILSLQRHQRPGGSEPTLSELLAFALLQ